jgi:putative sterol carrier protein
VSKFLSEEWLAELTEAVNAHDGFKKAIVNTELKLQFEVPDSPEDVEGRYFIAIADGVAEAGGGDTDEPDATITQDYETATAISKGDLNTQMAFMTGKLKVTGNMAKLMMNQAMLTQFADAASDMSIDY